MSVLAFILQQERHVREKVTEPRTPEWVDRLIGWGLHGVSSDVQKVGGIVMAILALATFVLVIWKGERILAWWRHRAAALQRVVVVVVAGVVIAMAAGGAYFYDYVQHDNEFCNTCHIMREPYQRMQETKHSQLNCHECHRQSIAESLRQLQLWVSDRPKEVGPHSPVETKVCAKCHITKDPEKIWQRISATAGHRVHLESDSSALKDVTCVTCHGEEVHRFIPASRTCGQSGCHDPGKTEVVLGKMAGQDDLHCVACHEFTRPVAERTPLDTARVALLPALSNCRSCHEMAKVLAGFDPAVDPHKAICGMCHNPHTQETPAAAAGACGTCHARADTLTAFHRGLRPAALGNCLGCHEAHTFKVNGADCVACHGGTVRDTRTFEHGKHRNLKCTECHSSRETHGGVSLTQAQCVECHHSTRVPGARGACTQCHGRSELAATRRVREDVTIRGRSRPRELPFDHDRHTKVQCVECHTQGTSLGVSRSCGSCHQNHHTATATCTTCHAPARQVHKLEVHLQSCGGSGCHEAARYGSMAQGRNTCLACHDMARHKPDQVCSACHRVTFSAAAPTRTTRR